MDAFAQTYFPIAVFAVIDSDSRVFANSVRHFNYLSPTQFWVLGLVRAPISRASTLGSVLDSASGKNRKAAIFLWLTDTLFPADKRGVELSRHRIVGFAKIVIQAAVVTVPFAIRGDRDISFLQHGFETPRLSVGVGVAGKNRMSRRVASADRRKRCSVEAAMR